MKNTRHNLLIAIAVIILSLAAACDDPSDTMPVTIIRVNVNVTAPVFGALFDDTTASGSGNFSIGRVSWMPDDYTFSLGTPYTASVTLTAAQNCFFAKNISATINGQNAAVTGGGSTVTLSYQFAEIPDHINESTDGTPGNPFKVYDTATLRRVGKDNISVSGWTLFDHYLQTQDIVLPPAGAGSNWTAIGTDSLRFRGTYDGGGHTISNLTINAASGSQGLFGYIGSDGVVKNVVIVNGSVRGGNTGGIAGFNYGTVEKCSFSGSVRGGGETGGITGQNFGTVQNCYSSGSVNATGAVGVTGSAGGIVGLNYNGTVQNCYSTVNVGGGSASGGIAGENSGTVQNCAALNHSVTTTSTNSSYIGRVTGDNTGTLANNYASAGMDLKYYWDGTTGDDKSPIDDGARVDGEEIDEEQYNDENWWKDDNNWKTTHPALKWDFDNVWDWNNEIKLPILKKNS